MQYLGLSFLKEKDCVIAQNCQAFPAESETG